MHDYCLHAGHIAHQQLEVPHVIAIHVSHVIPAVHAGLSFTVSSSEQSHSSGHSAASEECCYEQAG